MIYCNFLVATSTFEISISFLFVDPDDILYWRKMKKEGVESLVVLDWRVPTCSWTFSLRPKSAVKHTERRIRKRLAKIPKRRGIVS